MQAYRTWLGFYKGFMKLCRWNPEQLVQVANRYAGTLGMHPTPSFGAQTCCSILQSVLILCLRLTGSWMSPHHFWRSNLAQDELCPLSPPCVMCFMCHP